MSERRRSVAPPPVWAGGESLGRSVRWMQAGGEKAAPERTDEARCKPPRGQAKLKRLQGEFKQSEFNPTGNNPPVT